MARRERCTLRLVAAVCWKSERLAELQPTSVRTDEAEFQFSLRSERKEDAKSRSGRRPGISAARRPEIRRNRQQFAPWGTPVPVGLNVLNALEALDIPAAWKDPVHPIELSVGWKRRHTVPEARTALNQYA